jgi:hypothetical protein
MLHQRLPRLLLFPTKTRASVPCRVGAGVVWRRVGTLASPWNYEQGHCNANPVRVEKGGDACVALEPLQLIYKGGALLWRQLKVEPVTDPRTGASPVPTLHEPGKRVLRV